MSDNDAYDDFDDDGFFNDAETLAQVAKVEAEAVKASQAPKRTTQRYHHTVAPPKSTPSSRPPPKPSTKDPGRVNTEPRASTGGFGWEHGGKRQQDAERYIALVEERQAYWGTGKETKVEEEGDEPPDIVMTAEGAYDLQPVDIVDTHAPPTINGLSNDRFRKHIEAQEARKEEAMTKRRMAIQQETQSRSNILEPGPSTTRKMTKTVSGPILHPQPQGLNGSNRQFSRSISNGGAPAPRPLSRGPILPPIPSQSSQTPPIPSSQGSIVRKTAVQLDEEKRKSEALEAEVEKLKLLLSKQKSLNPSVPDAVSYQSQQVPDVADKADDGKELKTKLDTMQTDLYRAKGEAEQIRRAQKEETARHLAEADRLRARIEDMENKLRDREREAARQVENVKTQAVFANHAAQNSAMKSRAASQRPMQTPISNGSPRGKANEESFLQRTSLKGKAKAPPPSAPKFGALNNAFTASPKIKRARLSTVVPTGDFSPVKPSSPGSSPSKKASVAGKLSQPGSPMQDYDLQDDFIMDEIVSAPMAVRPEAVHTSRSDEKSELLHLLFNYAPPSPFQATCDPDVINRPASYRILHYQPSLDLDPEGRYSSSCSKFLSACGDLVSSLEDVLQAIAQSLSACLAVVTRDASVADATNFHLAELSITINIISLLARTSWIFRPMSTFLAAVEPSITDTLRTLVNSLIANKERIISLDRMLEADIENVRKSRVPSKTEAENAKPMTQMMYHWAEPSQFSPSQEAREKPASPPPVDANVKMWIDEMGRAIASLTGALCWHAGEMDIWQGDELVDIALGLTAPWLNTPLVVECSNVFWCASIFKPTFRSIMAQSTRWSGQDPALERMSRIILELPKDVPEDEVYKLVMTMVRAWSMMTVADPDAIVLIAQRSSVVPALTSILRRAVVRVWGIWLEDYDLGRYLEMVTYTMTLLHHFIKPHFTRSFIRGQTKSTDQSASQVELSSQVKTDDEIQPINLLTVFKDVRLQRSYRSWDHSCASALGALSWASPSVDIDDYPDFDLAHIQDMAQDLMDTLMEGPEGDEVYELYVDEDEEGPGVGGEEMEVDNEEVDQEALQQVVYEVEDDSD